MKFDPAGRSKDSDHDRVHSDPLSFHPLERDELADPVS
jgi:hypothetical protein